MIADSMLASVVFALSGAAGLYLAVAFLLIASQRPGPPQDPRDGDHALDFAALEDESAASVSLRNVLARDGMPISIRRYGGGAGPDAPLLIIVHGAGWHGGGYHGLARAIAASGAAEVIVPDLRGHGLTPFRRGDIDHIGQLEDDLCDLIKVCARPGGDVFMLGHSTGGGLVVRFAGGPYGAMLTKAVLIAPILTCNAPTMQRGFGAWIRPLTRRIIGLAMLNAVRITALNGLEAVSFNFPRKLLDGPEGASATTAYSYRLNVSYAPRRDCRRDAAALPAFCVIAGARDWAVAPEAHERMLARVNPRGSYHVLPGAGHMGIIREPEAARVAAAFLAR